MNDSEKKAFLKKLKNQGRNYEDFNKTNKNYWRGRIIVGVIFSIIIIILIIIEMNK